MLFGRGAFTAEDAVRSSQSLAAYAVGLPAFVLVKVLVPAFFARGDTKTPVWTGTIAVVLNLGAELRPHGAAAAHGSAAGVRRWRPGSTSVLLALAAAPARATWPADAELRRRLPRMLAAGLVMCGGAVGGAGARCSPRSAACTGCAGWRWRLLVAAGSGAYGIAGQVLGGFDLREAAPMSARRRWQARRWLDRPVDTDNAAPI